MGYPSSSDDMDDVDGWELLAGDGSFDDGRRELISREVGIDHRPLLDASYFIYPAPPPTHVSKDSEERVVDFMQADENEHQVKPADEIKEIPLVDLMGADDNKHQVKPADEIKEIPVVDVSVVKEVINEKVVEESKFVDMKVAELPECGKGDLPVEPFSSKDENNLNGCELVAEGKKDASVVSGLVEEEKGGGDAGGFGIWGWRMTGIGALCSLGVAAATICIIILGRQRQIRHRQQHSQKLRFNSCTDDSDLLSLLKRTLGIRKRKDAATHCGASNTLALAHSAGQTMCPP